MDDQSPRSTRLDDTQGQPREDRPALGRWLAQQPRDDSVPYAWRGTQEISHEEARSEEQIKDGHTSVDCLHHVDGSQVTCGSNLSLVNHIPPYQHQHTKGGCGQPSSNVHDISQSDILSHQQQEYLIHVPFKSPGQETLEQPFNQASMPLGLLETAGCSGASFAIQQNTEIDQWLDIPDISPIHEIISDRRRALLQQLGKLQQELSTIDSAFGSQQPFAPEHSVFNSNFYSSHGYSMDGTSATHTTESFSRLDTNQPRGYIPPCHPVLVPSHSSENPSLTKQWGYGSPTIPSYSSDTRSRAMDEVSSEMTISTAPTTNKSLYRDNVGSHNLEPAHVLRSNLENITKPTSDSPEIQNHGSKGSSQHVNSRMRRSQYGKSERKSKNRRVGKINEDEHNMHAYSCPFYLKNPADYGVGNWELCAKSYWTTYQRMREHLLRKHILPAILCEKCFEEFEDDNSLQEHHLESQCERKAHSPYLSREQQSQLETRIKGGMKEAEKLEQMYGMFSLNGDFPGPKKKRQIRLEMLLRAAIAISLIPREDIERIANDTLQAIRRAGSTVWN